MILLNFFRARELKVNEAFEMLKKTLQWRKEMKIDSILKEDFGSDLASDAYMNGVDRVINESSNTLCLHDDF